MGSYEARRPTKWGSGGEAPIKGALGPYWPYWPLLLPVGLLGDLLIMRNKKRIPYGNPTCNIIAALALAIKARTHDLSNVIKHHFLQK